MASPLYNLDTPLHLNGGISGSLGSVGSVAAAHPDGKPWSSTSSIDFTPTSSPVYNNISLQQPMPRRNIVDLMQDDFPGLNRTPSPGMYSKLEAKKKSSLDDSLTASSLSKKDSESVTNFVNDNDEKSKLDEEGRKDTNNDQGAKNSEDESIRKGELEKKDANIKGETEREADDEDDEDDEEIAFERQLRMSSLLSAAMGTREDLELMSAAPPLRSASTPPYQTGFGGMGGIGGGLGMGSTGSRFANGMMGNGTSGLRNSVFNASSLSEASTSSLGGLSGMNDGVSLGGLGGGMNGLFAVGSSIARSMTASPLQQAQHQHHLFGSAASSSSSSLSPSTQELMIQQMRGMHLTEDDYDVLANLQFQQLQQQQQQQQLGRAPMADRMSNSPGPSSNTLYGNSLVGESLSRTGTPPFSGIVFYATHTHTHILKIEKMLLISALPHF